MAHDVFISHSTKDKPIADAVCATLEHEGIRCWMAPRDIIPGTSWGESIVDAISGSRIMVLVFSSSANQSQQILREVERAVDKGIPVIPFRIENVDPSKSLEYYISTPHWLDALSPPMEKHIEQLSNTIKFLISKNTGEGEGFKESNVRPHVVGAPSGPAVQTTSGTSAKTIAVTGGVAALLAAAVLLYFFLFNKPAGVRPVIYVDNTVRDMYIGKLAVGDGGIEYRDNKYVIKSSQGQSTDYPFATRELKDFKASAKLQMLDTTSQWPSVGLLYDRGATESERAAGLYYGDGAIFFGKDKKKVYVTRLHNNTWERIDNSDILSDHGALDEFQIIKSNGIYRFLFNGKEIARYKNPVPQSAMVKFFVADSTTGAFKDWIVYGTQSAVMSGMEYDTDRKGDGPDLRNFALSENDPELCQNACAAESECIAWTYVKPGVQGESSRCWLKGGPTTAVPIDCCISGTKRAGYSEDY